MEENNKEVQDIQESNKDEKVDIQPKEETKENTQAKSDTDISIETQEDIKSNITEKPTLEPTDILIPIRPPHKLYCVGSVVDENNIQIKNNDDNIKLYSDVSEAQKLKTDTNIVLLIDSYRMTVDGYKFYLLENGLYTITDDISPQYIMVIG